MLIVLLHAVAALAAASTSFALAACQVCHDPCDSYGRPEVPPPSMRVAVIGFGALAAALAGVAVIELAVALAALFS